MAFMSPVHGPLHSGPPGRQFNNSRAVNLAGALSGQGPQLHADPRLAPAAVPGLPPHLNQTLATALLIHRLQGELSGGGNVQPLNPFGNPNVIGGGGKGFEPNPPPEIPAGTGGLPNLPFGPSFGHLPQPGAVESGFHSNFMHPGEPGVGMNPAARLVQAMQALHPRAINSRFNPNRGPREPQQLFFHPAPTPFNYRGGNRGGAGY